MIGSLILIVLAIAALTLPPGDRSASLQSQRDIATLLEQCRRQTMVTIQQPSPSIDMLGTISRHCYEQVRGEGVLSELDIRRAAFMDQAYQGKVVLWMVVAITLSGVALAGLQLVMGYRLVQAGYRSETSESEVTLERNKIAVRSSVTGLLILTVSFAFFLVYVLWIYTIKETSVGGDGGGTQIESSEQASSEAFGALEDEEPPAETNAN